jgi:hypothetical protein
MDPSGFLWIREIPKQRGWSFGRCPDCRGDGPVRIEEVLMKVWFGPFLIDKCTYPQARCDFCERDLDDFPTKYLVAINDWRRSDKADQLADLLGLRPTSPSASVYQRHYALLWGIQLRTSLSEIDLRNGMIIGIFVGGTICTGLGAAIGAQWPGEFVWAAIAVGLLSGLTLGPAVGGWVSLKWQQRIHGFALLRAAFQRYPLDCKLLREVADKQKMTRRIRRLTRRFAEFVASGAAELDRNKN